MRLKYLDKYTDNRGRLRYYFRRKGKRIALPDPKDHEAFMSAYNAALASKTHYTKAKAGTLRWLVEEYQRSPSWHDLARETQRTYETYFKPLIAEHGNRLYRDLEHKHIKADLNRLAEKPSVYNKRLRAYRQIFNWAFEEGMIKENPYRRIKERKTGEGFQDFGEDNILAYEQHWEVGTRERLAFDLALYTANRRGDLHLMSRKHIKDGKVRTKQHKTRTVTWIPLHSALSRSIEATPANGLYLIHKADGEPYTKESFGNWMRANIRKAGIEDNVSLHGLRKASARRLAEAGCTSSEIMSITGHKNISEVELYTKARDQKLLAERAISKMEHEQNLPSNSDNVPSMVKK